MIQAAKWIPGDRKNSILDYGCGDGQFISKLTKKSKKLFACDTLKDFITSASTRYKHVKFILIKPNKRLPFKNDSFNIITLLEVLEHVGDEKKMIKELHRVIKPDGLLVLSVPNKGIVSFLDKSNLKFRFPILHKLLYILFYGKEKYFQNFSGNKKMFGDITISRNMYHHHYGLNDLKKIFRGRFEILEVRYHSLFAPILHLIADTIYLIIGKRTPFLYKLIYIDANIFNNSYGYGLIVKAKALKQNIK